MASGIIRSSQPVCRGRSTTCNLITFIPVPSRNIAFKATSGSSSNHIASDGRPALHTRKARRRVLSNTLMGDTHKAFLGLLGKKENEKAKGQTQAQAQVQSQTQAQTEYSNAVRKRLITKARAGVRKAVLWDIRPRRAEARTLRFHNSILSCLRTAKMREERRRLWIKNSRYHSQSHNTPRKIHPTTLKLLLSGHVKPIQSVDRRPNAVIITTYHPARPTHELRVSEQFGYDVQTRDPHPLMDSGCTSPHVRKSVFSRSVHLFHKYIFGHPTQ